MDRESIIEALEAEGSERIECPVCDDEIPALELAADHAHSEELLTVILNLLDRSQPDAPTDDFDDEDGGELRETIIRYDPENVMRGESRERLRQLDEAKIEEKLPSFSERRVYSVGDEDDYERISEATWGVANAFSGSLLHAGHELVACPDCGYEGQVDQAVFPGGTDHHSDAQKEGEE